MTKEEIIELAREAEMGFDLTSRTFFAELERFANLVAAKERERCAKAADELRHTDGFSAESADWCSGTIHAAYAIRALPTGNLKLEDLR